MKIKSAGLLTALTVMLGATTANANLLFDIYAGGTIGYGGTTLYAEPNDISKSAMSYGAVIGIDIPIFRFELEYDYLDSDIYSMQVGMINAYAKMPLPIVKPYLGVGVGSIFDGEFKNTSIDADIAYQGMLGVTFDLPVLPFNIDVEGRVLYAPDIYETVLNDKPDLLHYDARVKLRYVF